MCVCIFNCFSALRSVQQWGPLLVTEAWAGWFDAWGASAHTVRSAGEVAALVDELLSLDASFNLYMFAGGSNGATRNGALLDDVDNRFWPQTSSYDYSAPIAETGELTSKYFAVCEAIARHRPELAQQHVIDALRVQSSVRCVCVYVSQHYSVKFIISFQKKIFQ